MLLGVARCCSGSAQVLLRCPPVAHVLLVAVGHVADEPVGTERNTTTTRPKHEHNTTEHEHNTTEHEHNTTEH